MATQGSKPPEWWELNLTSVRDRMDWMEQRRDDRVANLLFWVCVGSSFGLVVAAYVAAKLCGGSEMHPRYQLFGDLRTEEFAALEADIVARGVQVSVEYDEDGNVLDGHHRVAICEKHGLEIPFVTRKFKTEGEKREHVIKLNLARRHLEPWQWGRAFKLLLEGRGVKTGQGSSAAKRHSQSDTVSEVAAELGVEERTARRRVRQADVYESLPAKARKAIERGEKTLVQVKREMKDQERAAKEKAAMERVAAAKTISEALGAAKFGTIVGASEANPQR